MDDRAETLRSLSDRLAGVQESLRAVLARTTDQSVVAELGDAAHEIGLLRLALDAPTPESRRHHLRVPETIGTALMVDGREVDAVIVDISVGGVGLVTDERLPAGTMLQVAVPPVGWLDAEVVSTDDDRLHVRFRADGSTTDQQRALLDLVLRHYD